MAGKSSNRQPRVRDSPIAISDATQVRFNMSQLWQFIGIVVSLTLLWAALNNRLDKIENIVSSIYTKVEIDKMFGVLRASKDSTHLDHARRIHRLEKRLGISDD